MYEVVQGFRLSPQQRRLWQWQQKDAAFRSWCVVRIDGPLDLSILRRAVQSVISRHEVLRTLFYCPADVSLPLQRIVDESTPVMPLTDRARRRVSAEEMTRVWCHERRVRRVVLRVPGIYGPGRLPLERLRKSEPVVRPEDAGISNRIHVDDLVTACEAAIENKEARGVYNVTDGNSISSTSFIDKVAQLSGLPQPPRVSMEEAQLTFSPERLSFLN